MRINPGGWEPAGTPLATSGKGLRSTLARAVVLSFWNATLCQDPAAAAFLASSEIVAADGSKLTLRRR